MKKLNKLELIIKSGEARVLVNPDGSITKERFNSYFKKNIQGVQLLLDRSNITKYNYDSNIGVVTPYDEGIATIIKELAIQLRNEEEGNMRDQAIEAYRHAKIEKNENINVLYVSNNFGQCGGGQIIDNGAHGSIISDRYNQMGGMRYTFGAEIETSAGRLTKDDLNYANTAMEGDRTISGYEYVTGVLSGNDGLVRLKALASAISKRTIIGEQNGLHFHIGGANSPKIWTPNFNRMFSVNAIKLGVQIEDEMFSLLYPARRNDRYLKSIKEWGNINGVNWRDILGDYVFRGSNDIFRDYDDYETHTLDSEHNSKFHMSRWAKTKHKWLNLNHCNSKSHVNTVEFRLYSATGDYDKILNFLLLSMGIVWFIENRQRLIWNGEVNLTRLVDEAYMKRGHKDIAIALMKFINKRKKQFKA